MTLKVNINHLHKRPGITSLYNGEKLCFTVRYGLSNLPTFGQAMPMIRKKNPRQISKFRVVNDLGKCRLDSAFPTRSLPRGMGFMHDLLTTRVRFYSIRLQTTVACVPCGDIDMILHWLITCTVTHELWQCIRRRTAALLRTDPTLLLPKVAISSWGHHMANLLTYSMEQSPSWEANWFCS